MTRPAMKDLSPAFARIAKIAHKFQELHDKQDAEFQRINKEGRRVALIAIRKAGLKRGETLIQIGRWHFGIYKGTQIEASRNGQWWCRTYYQSVLKSGRPGKARHICARSIEHPGDVVNDVKIVGKVVGKVVRRHDEEPTT